MSKKLYELSPSSIFIFLHLGFLILVLWELYEFFANNRPFTENFPYFIVAYLVVERIMRHLYYKAK